MAQTVSRRFRVYDVKAFVLDLDEGGNPIKSDLFTGEIIISTPNDRIIRRAIADALGMKRLPDGTRIEYTDMGERVYAMTADDFIANATVVNQ